MSDQFTENSQQGQTPPQITQQDLTNQKYQLNQYQIEQYAQQQYAQQQPLPVKLPPQQEVFGYVELHCVSMKNSGTFSLYAAMNGYDYGVSNPFASGGDPAIRNRIFRHTCNVPIPGSWPGTWDLTPGYFNFISDSRVSMHCDADFSLKTYTTEDEYNKARGSTNSLSKNTDAGLGLIIF